MDYPQTLDYLYKQLPVFQRVGASAYKKDLGNTVALLNALDNPQQDFKSVHIAGTNGKGSVAHMLSAIFQSSGYKCGLYTSPHLKDFSERIRIDGDTIDHEFIVSFVERIKPQIESIKPSFFEVTVAMAFEYFKYKKVDIAIVETGMGGRLDSTNVLNPILSVITNISYDHQQFLGDTIEKIAFEKAGIIKQNTPVVIGEYQSEAAHVFQYVAEEKNAPIYFSTDHALVLDCLFEENGLRVKVETEKNVFDFRSDMTGGYQLKNILTVLKSVEVLNQNGFKVSKENLSHGFGHVKLLTGLKGRWEVLQRHPLVVADVGHNEGGVKDNLKHIKQIKPRKLFIIWGMVKDKDASKILELLPKDACYYFSEPHLERGLKVQELATQASEYDLKGVIEEDVNKALQRALNEAEKDDMIFISGSTFLVAELEQL